MKKWIILIIILVVIFGAIFFLNLLLLITCFVSFILSLIIFYKFRKSNSAKFILISCIVIPFGIIIFTGNYPKSNSLETYSKTKIPLTNYRLANSGRYDYLNRIPPKQKNIEKTEFDKKYFELISHAKYVEYAGNLINQSRQLKNKLQENNPDDIELKKLHQDLESLEESIRNDNLDDLVKIRRKVDKLNTFLDSSKNVLENIQLSEKEDFDKNFNLRILSFSLEEQYDKMKKLQVTQNAILKEITKNIIYPEVSLHAELLEENNFFVWNLKEEITFSVPYEISVKKIDISPLILESRIRDIRQEIFYYYDNDSTKAYAPDSLSIYVNPEIQKIVITNNLIIRDSVRFCSPKEKYNKLRYTQFRWPSPFPVLLRVKLNLKNIGLSENYDYYCELSRENKIDKIVLPKHSYYTSGFSFKRTYSNQKDILYSEGETLEPKYFRRYNNLWIELLPDNLFFRNPLIQRFKAFLIADNLISELIFALIGAAFAAMIVKKKENE